MKAVWSFWSKPHLFDAAPAGLAIGITGYLGAVLGNRRQHYANLELYTDQHGAAILVDDLGLRSPRYRQPWIAQRRKILTGGLARSTPTDSSRNRCFISTATSIFGSGCRNILNRQPSLPESGAIGLGERCYQPNRVDRTFRAAAANCGRWIWYRQGHRPQRANAVGSSAANITVSSSITLTLLCGWRPIRPIVSPGDNWRLAQPYDSDRAVSAGGLRGFHSIVGCRRWAGEIRYLFDSSPRPPSGSRDAPGYTHLIADSKKNPLPPPGWNTAYGRISTAVQRCLNSDR